MIPFFSVFHGTRSVILQLQKWIKQFLEVDRFK